MATQRQRKAVNNIVDNGGIVSKAMEKAGYSKKTAKTPQKLTESKGFKELCEEYGLTDELLLKSLVEDIKNKKKNRKPELELGFKIKGRLQDKIDLTTKGEKIYDTKQIELIARRIANSNGNG